MTQPCYIFDIDGTLANNRHRTHYLERIPKDWNAYNEQAYLDTAFDHMVAVANYMRIHYPIVFCTGRHEGQRTLTTNWLKKYIHFQVPITMYMRKEDDHRPDHIVKRELLDQIRGDGFEPVMAFDDRNSVVKMWREAGIPCAQVAEGDF